MKIAIFAPISWRTPPKHYGPWETVASNLCEGLYKRGHDVTLFATGDSKTKGKLCWVCPKPLEENPELDAKAYEYLHIANLLKRAGEFDIIHNHLNYYLLCFSNLIKTKVVTTLHGSAALEPESRKVYDKFKNLPYVSISNSEREGAPELNYIKTVYNGIKIEDFPFCGNPDDYLIFLGRISFDKGTHFACEFARKTNQKLVIVGVVPDDEKDYFEAMVKPHIDGRQIKIINGNELGDKEKKSILSRAKAFLHLIAFKEPFGLVMVEAMACGTPVIGFNKGSVSEVVGNPSTGFVVKTLREAESKLKDIERIDRKACRKRIEDLFTVDKMVEGYLEAYNLVLKNL